MCIKENYDLDVRELNIISDKKMTLEDYYKVL